MQDQEPFAGYNGMTVPQVLERLEGLSPDELAAVKQFEAAHQNRKGIVAYEAAAPEPLRPKGRPPLAEVAEQIAAAEEEQAEQQENVPTTDEESA
jgi:hypothetical protein